MNRVRLAGGVPRLCCSPGHGWRLDVDALAMIDPRPVTAAPLMSPSMPTGAVFSYEEWQALIAFCEQANCWLINDAAMERILYDGRPVIHPARSQGCAPRSSPSAPPKEYRMIGWRGWVVGPADIVADVAGSASRTWSVKQALRWAPSQQPSATLMMAFKPALRNGNAAEMFSWMSCATLRSFHRTGWSLLLDVSTGARWRNGIKTPARIGEDCCDTDAPLGSAQSRNMCALYLPMSQFSGYAGLGNVSSRH